jgi:hypothetical protein
MLAALDFPGSPSISVESTDGAGSDVDVEVRKVEYQPPGVPIFAASSFRFPGGPASLPTLESFLSGVRTRDLAVVGGRIIGELTFPIGTVGRELVIEGDRGLYRSRTILYGDSTVTWTVGGSILDIGSAEADRFLDSIRLP